MVVILGRIFRKLGKYGFLNFIADKTYIKILYRLFMKQKLDLIHPKSLNEKIQWLKLYDRKEMYSKMVDKYTSKEYVSNIIGKKYIIPTYGVWDNFDNIDFSKLPTQFVLKCTHDCGSVIVCKNKYKFDIEFASKRIKKAMSFNYFYVGREWAYKNIKPRIIAEQYIEDADTKDLRDYKFYCFTDVVDSVLVCLDRVSGNTKFYLFDKNWNLKRYNKFAKDLPAEFTLPKPNNIDEMFEIAKKLSVASGAPFLRVDLYNANGKIYFGELTFYPDCGLDNNRLPETDLYFGGLIKLPKNIF